VVVPYYEEENVDSNIFIKAINEINANKLIEEATISTADFVVNVSTIISCSTSVVDQML